MRWILHNILMKISKYLDLNFLLFTTIILAKIILYYIII